MATVKIHKTTALPGTLEGHSVYLVAPTSKPDYVEMYVTNADGSTARRIINSDDIQAMIDAAVASATGGGIEIVADIAARNALSPTNGKYVLVLDASADPTVDSGAASYVWRSATSQWIKLTEYESMDMTITWAMIQGKPSSAPSAIDAAVANSHTHANMTQLNKVGEDANGDFTYNGNPPRARLETAGW
jgi:hypothetical protein